MALDLVKILKKVPQGTVLYSPLVGYCCLDYILESEDYPIFVTCYTDSGDTESRAFAKDGCYYNAFKKGAECLLFPDKGVSWEEFDDKWPQQFEPFQKVLMQCDIEPDARTWVPCFYCFWDAKTQTHVTSEGNTKDTEILPYNKETMHLVGTKVE